MTKLANWIYEASRQLTWQEMKAFLKECYFPKISPALRERDERIIALIEEDLKAVLGLRASEEPKVYGSGKQPSEPRQIEQ